MEEVEAEEEEEVGGLKESKVIGNEKHTWFSSRLLRSKETSTGVRYA